MPLANISAFEEKTKKICKEISQITYSKFAMDFGIKIGRGYKYASNAAFAMALGHLAKKNMPVDARNPLKTRILKEAEKICAQALEQEFKEKENRTNNRRRSQAYEQIDRWLSDNLSSVMNEYEGSAKHA
jgi:hypothetical protein